MRRSFKRNRFQKFVFIFLTFLIAVGLVVPLYSLFQNDQGSGQTQTTGATQQQSLQDRLSSLEQKAKENPKDEDVLMELAQTYIYAGKPDPALKTYGQVLAIDPNNTQARYETAYTYYISDKNDQAVTQLQDLLKKDPENKDALLLLGFVLDNGKKDYTAGIQELEKYIAIAKEGPDVEKAKQVIDQWKNASAKK